MRYVGFNEYYHDAGIAIIDDTGNIEFASSAERYTKIKNDNIIPEEMIQLTQKGDEFLYYEDSDLRIERYLKMYPSWEGLLPEELPNKAPLNYKRFLSKDFTFPFTRYIDHHLSHAANGLYTRPWKSLEDTVIITMDGVGEYDTFCIYNHKLKKLDSWTDPKSVGLMYTQTTQDLGLRSMEDEYVVMGLAAYGEPVCGEEIYEWFSKLTEENYYKNSGSRGWRDKFKRGKIKKEDYAASIQYFTEKIIMEQAVKARQYGSKLIFSGGVAQNILAMSKIRPLFDDMWIPVAPSDSGSSLGVAAYFWCKDNKKDRINFEHAYLGHNIEKQINPKEVVDHLLEHRYCGIASGRAEFGPRALGNRSLIADVRYDVKDTVNEIKRRQKYRPFAPAILEEHADKYFEGPMNEYMQYQCKALHDYKSVTHVDGTARVQIVKKDCKSVFRQIIEEFYERTGVPMLLNTSLNIRGRPIVNDQSDAELFEKRYRVKVF